MAPEQERKLIEIDLESRHMSQSVLLNPAMRDELGERAKYLLSQLDQLALRDDRDLQVRSLAHVARSIFRHAIKLSAARPLSPVR